MKPQPLQITHTAALHIYGNLTGKQLAAFTAAVPEGARIETTVHRGDPRDPREAGHIDTVIKATWTEDLA